jgi:predicted GH43/DUF377 family glycosyl hydrolase
MRRFLLRTCRGRRLGQVPNLVFVEVVEGLVRRGKQYLFYYGGADTNLGVAEAAVTP